MLASQGTETSGKPKAKPFVQAAYEMAMKNDPIVGFSSDGTTLEIRDVPLLCEEVLPKYFKHKNISSFFRQLNMYGFEKVAFDGAAHAFRHDFFRKDRADLLDQVSRSNSTRKPHKIRQSPGAQSDSYSNSSSTQQRPRNEPKRAPPADALQTKLKPFVYAAYEMVTANEGPYVGFSQDGTALEIRDVTNFAEKILPRYFKHKNISSFIRQLNMYGFEKIDGSAPRDVFQNIPHTFHHEYFRRGRDDWLPLIQRKTKGKKSTSGEESDSPKRSRYEDENEIGGSASGRRVNRFIESLYEVAVMSNHPEIGMSLDGTTLEIRDVPGFARNIMSVCFNHVEYQAFMRQLSVYGFTQIGENRFRHPYFIRGRQDLLDNVVPAHALSEMGTAVGGSQVGSNRAAASILGNLFSMPALSAFGASPAFQPGASPTLPALQTSSSSSMSTTVTSKSASHVAAKDVSGIARMTSTTSTNSALSDFAGRKSSHTRSSSGQVDLEDSVHDDGLMEEGDSDDDMEGSSNGEEEDDEEDGIDGGDGPIKTSSRSGVVHEAKKTKSTPFVQAAYEIAMLDNAAVGFNATGNALQIRDESLLSTEVLPKFFKHNNVSSFIRQLNMYGFEKVVGTVAAHTFQHEHFQKGRPDLLRLIQRKSSKAAAASKLRSKSDMDRKFSRKMEMFIRRSPPPDAAIRTKPTPFVHSTYELAMLNNEAIGFNANGCALEIRSEAALADLYLPKYFKHKNVSSFIRQLNMYGFEKTESGPNAIHTFQHEYFERNREDLLPRITRKHVKGDKRGDDADASSGGGGTETMDAITGLTMLRSTVARELPLNSSPVPPQSGQQSSSMAGQFNMPWNSTSGGTSNDGKSMINSSFPLPASFNMPNSFNMLSSPAMNSLPGFSLGAMNPNNSLFQQQQQQKPSGISTPLQHMLGAELLSAAAAAASVAAAAAASSVTRSGPALSNNSVGSNVDSSSSKPSPSMNISEVSSAKISPEQSPPISSVQQQLMNQSIAVDIALKIPQLLQPLSLVSASSSENGSTSDAGGSSSSEEGTLTPKTVKFGIT